MTRPSIAPTTLTARPHDRLRRRGASARAACVVAIAALLAACSPSSDPAKVLAEARAAVERKDTRTAEVQLKDLLQNGQDSAEARELLGRVHLLNGDLRSAEKELRRALDLGGERERIAPALIQTLVRLGEHDRALADAAALPVTGAQAKAEISTALGRSYFGRGRRDDARKAFEAALVAQPGHVSAKAGLITLQGSTDRQAALAAAQRELESAPDAPELLTVAGDLQLALGRLDQARETYARLVKVQPAEPEPRARLAATLIDLNQIDAAAEQVAQLKKLAPGVVGTLQVTGLLEFRRGNLAAARDAVQQAQRLSPDYLPTAALAASVALASNAPELAERNARLLVERVPGSPQGYRLLAAAYLQMNAPDKAVAVLQPVVARGVEDAALLTLAGEAALKTGDFASSTKLFQRASDLDPQDAGKRTGLALARLSGGDREGGFADLEAATKLPAASAQADFALIAARLRDRDYPRALAAADALVAKRPQDPAVHNARGSVLAAKGDFSAARAAFEKAAQLRPADMAAAANLAGLDMRDNRKADARKRFEAVIAADPKNIPARMALAQIAAGERDKEGMRKQLEAARNADTDAVGPMLGMAGWHLDHGSPRDAVSLLQEAVVKHPTRSDVLEMLGMAQSRAGDRDQALATFDRMLRVRPDSIALHMRVGELKLSLKDEPGALAAFRRAGELAPKAIEPRVAMATALLRAGRKAEAQQVAAGLQRDQPKSPAGLLLVGDIAATDEQWAQAADAYRKANAVTRTPAGAVKMHQALLRAGRAVDADAALRAHLAERPDDLGTRVYFGDQLVLRSRWPEAAEQYRIILARDERNVIALNNLAWSLHRMKDPKALEFAERALSAAPQSAPVIDTAGVILADRGDVDRAVDLLRQAVAIAPREPQYRLHLAETMAKRGDKGGAREQLASLLKETPSGPVADAARDLERRL